MAKKQHKKGKVIEYSKLERKVAALWTRVSSVDQEKHGCGLEFQDKICREYAAKNNIIIKKAFGGKYESAKTEGDGYKKMIQEVAKDREINMILVHSFDRFSRAGNEAIVTKAFLKSKGIYVISATQKTDPDSAAGEFMENIFFLFSQFENSLRRDKCVAGMTECLRKGQWYSRPPLGYDKHMEGKDHILTVNDKGEILRNAFIWKANEHIGDVEIVERLKDLGLVVNRKTLNDILHNRLYCGYITSPLLDEGEEIPFNDKQEILIDEATWNKANGITRCGYEVAEITESTPLKRHVRCSKCGNYLTGYSRIKRNKKGEEHEYYYYKCNTKGCGVNASAIQLHTDYAEMLDKFRIPREFSPILCKVLEKVFAEYNTFKAESKSRLLKRKVEIGNLIEKAQIRFGVGDISEDVYNATINKLRGQEAENKALLDEASENLSNQQKFINKVIATTSKLGDLWRNGNFRERQKIQNLVYPDGIFYDKDSEDYRTDSVNPALEIFRRFTEGCGEDKRKADLEGIPNLRVVEYSGLEPLTSTLPVLRSTR